LPEKKKDETYKEMTGETTIDELLKEKAPFAQIREKGTEIAAKKTNFAAELKREEELLESRESAFAPIDIRATADEGKKPVSFAEEIKREEAVLEKQEEIAPPPPAVSAPAISQLAAKEIPAKAPVATPVKKIAAAPGPSFRPAPTRPRMEDVKFTPKLFGPIDELENLTLADFRRLSADPRKAGQKLIEKLDILEEESLDKRVAGIKALKKSPLYSQYSAIISRSFELGQPAGAVIRPEDNITLEEFSAISELNKMMQM
jgi:hypothetical protein